MCIRDRYAYENGRKEEKNKVSYVTLRAVQKNKDTGDVKSCLKAMSFILNLEVDVEFIYT